MDGSKASFTNVELYKTFKMIFWGDGTSPYVPRHPQEFFYGWTPCVEQFARRPTT